MLLVTDTHLDGGVDPPGDSKKQLPVTILPQVPVPHCALRARVWMLYEERRIDRGRDAYDESRQTVTLLRVAEDKEDLDIMSADEVSPSVWSIHLCDKEKCDGKENKILQAGVNNGPLRDLVFTDYGQVVKLIHWLKTSLTNTIPEQNLRFGYPLQSTETLVPFRKADDDCQPRNPEPICKQ